MSPTVEELQAQLTALQALLVESWKPITYRDIWADEVRLYVDGRDWTWFRGVPSQVGGYQLQEPYAYGPADFAFPQVTELELAKLGRKGHPLRPLRHGALVELWPVKDGQRLSKVEWRGFITTIDIRDHHIQIHCDGDVSGRLALRDRQPAVFPIKKDIGTEIYDSLLYCGINLTTRGQLVGIETRKKGGSGDCLAYTDELLATTQQLDGDQKTIAAVGNGRRYALVDKDTTTVHATVFVGAEGVNLEIKRDMKEEPNHIFGRGTDPDGQKWINPVAPNFVRGDAPPFPGTLQRGDSGEDVRVLQSKLAGQGYLDRFADAAGDFDDDTRRAVKDLQEDAGLPETGVANAATWRAAFNVSVTGLSFRNAQVLPLAVLPKAKKWLRTANGSIFAENPRHDPSVQPVDLTVDHGDGVWKRRARRWSRRQMQRIHDGDNWYGTLALDGADVFAGNVNAATSNPKPMSRHDLRPGMNIKAVFPGKTLLFHIAGKNVDGDRNVSCAIDTRARDLLTLGQMIARNKESRSHPARQWVREQRRGQVSDLFIYSELGGRLDEDVPLKGGQWNKVGIPAGQSGTLEHVELHLRDVKCEFVAGVGMRDRSIQKITADAGHPFTKPAVGRPKWEKPHVQNLLKKRHLFIYTIGQKSQPLGYYPDAKIGDDGKATKAPLTGDWEDAAGVNFHAVDDCAFYLYIYPTEDCVLQAGHLFKVQQTEGS